MPHSPANRIGTVSDAAREHGYHAVRVDDAPCSSLVDRYRRNPITDEEMAPLMGDLMKTDDDAAKRVSSQQR